MNSVAGLTRSKLNWLAGALEVVSFTVAVASLGAGQTIVNGPRISGPQPQAHFSGPPFPTGGPPVPGSSNYGYRYHYAPYYNNGYYGGRYRGGGWAYVIPYYYPTDSSYYGYDYVGGGDGGPGLYSGPPLGPNDPSYHMIVEEPPASPYGDEPEQAYAAPVAAPQPPAAPPPEVKPCEPTVLVFRSGKQQEVTNYAIMGDSLYVFDQGRKKIALADLDLPATVKANDDRGLEFKIPPSAKKKTTTTVPQTATPDQNQTTTPPPNVAAVMP